MFLFIWGGIHASLLPEQTLENPYADIIVVGEGEETFLELVKALESGTPLNNVPGICYKENGKVHHTADRPFVKLDEQPPLSYHLINMDHYRRRLFGMDHISFNSSRGCTFGCSLLLGSGHAQEKMEGHEARKRSWISSNASSVITTYEDSSLRMTISSLIWNGLIISSKELSVPISKSPSENSRFVQMPSADWIENFLNCMVRAGVKRISVGVESGSQRMLDLIKKDCSPSKKFIEANRKLIPYPIVPLFLFMMGLPTETPEEFAQSIRLAVQLTDENPRAVKTFNIYTPYPGTETL